MADPFVDPFQQYQYEMADPFVDPPDIEVFGRLDPAFHQTNAGAASQSVVVVFDAPLRSIEADRFDAILGVPAEGEAHAAREIAIGVELLPNAGIRDPLVEIVVGGENRGQPFNIAIFEIACACRRKPRSVARRLRVSVASRLVPARVPVFNCSLIQSNLIVVSF